MLPQIYSQIAETGVVSIIRGLEGPIVDNTVQALYEGGIRAVEITFNTPGAAGIIERLKKEYSGKMIIGAGTVLDPETARIAILAGADYILSPSLNLKVIEVCNRYGKLAVPGVLTPTEVVNAIEAGAQIVKLFPARAFGPVYIKDLKGPLNQVEIMAVGGITIENAGEYIKNGAMSVGVGSELVNAKLITAGNYGEISRKAALILENIKAARA